MRPGHEPSEVLDLPGGRSHRFVNPERFSAALRSTWTWQGTEAFLGLRAATGRVSVPTKGDSPSALIQKGDWCGSATRPPPRERKPKVRSRTGQRASRQDIGSRRRRERKKRPFDRGQLNGDTPRPKLDTVRGAQPNTSAACSSTHAGPSASIFNRLACFCAEATPLLTNASNATRSSSLSRTMHIFNSPAPLWIIHIKRGTQPTVFQMLREGRH